MILFRSLSKFYCIANELAHGLIECEVKLFSSWKYEFKLIQSLDY